MRPIALAALIALAGCTDPTLRTSVSVGSGGVSVGTSASGQVGGATVTVSG